MSMPGELHVKAYVRDDVPSSKPSLVSTIQNCTRTGDYSLATLSDEPVTIATKDIPESETRLNGTYLSTDELVEQFRAELVEQGLLPKDRLFSGALKTVKIESQNTCVGHGSYMDIMWLTAVLPSISIEFKNHAYHLECTLSRRDMSPNELKDLVYYARKGAGV